MLVYLFNSCPVLYRSDGETSFDDYRLIRQTFRRESAHEGRQELEKTSRVESLKNLDNSRRCIGTKISDVLI
jgi:hypothetical protein